MIFDPKQGKLVPAAPKAPFFTPPAADFGLAPRDETEEEEVVSGKESDVQRGRAETDYLSGGAALAREVLGEDASAPLHACHMRGGVLIAVDQACALLGQIRRPITPRQKKDAAAAALAGAYATDGKASNGGSNGAAAGAARGSELAARSETRPEARSLGDWPTPLPFAVGLAPVAPKEDARVMSWRRLASTAKGVEDSCHGFAAVGLPPGCAVTVLTQKRCRLRAALGSSQPRLFTADAMRERLERVAATRQKRRVEMECEKNLASLSRAYALIGEPFPPEPRTGPFADFSGVLRGHCLLFNGCPGFELPKCHHEPRLMSLCVHCGCDATAHEQMRTEDDQKAEREDDILKNYKWDS